MHDKFSGWNYVFWFIAIVFILFGAVRAHTLGNDNQGLQRSLRTNQSNRTSLQQDERRTNLSDYEKNISRQGNDLYRDLPSLDRKISDIVRPAYTKITDQKSFDKLSPSIKKQAKGNLTDTVLGNAQPQVSQASNRPTSPYADIKDVHIENQYSNYNQGQLVILTDVTYTIPGRTVMDGRKITMPTSRQHDYYWSTYNINSGELDAITNTHSQQGGD